MEQSFKGSEIMFDSQQLGLQFGPLYVSLFGHQKRMIEDEGHIASKLAVALGASASKICRVIVASDQNQEGFQLTKVADYTDFLRADATILAERRSAAMMQTGDCATGILYCSRTNKASVFHGGRPALTPFCKEYSKTCDGTIVEDALLHLCGNGPKDDVIALVIGNICGACFKHEKEEAHHLAEPFLPLGERVFANIENRALDLYAVIKHRLMHAGVLEQNITHAGPCTFETPALSSHRRKDTDRNTTVVVWR